MKHKSILLTILFISTLFPIFAFGQIKSSEKVLKKIENSKFDKSFSEYVKFMKKNEMKISDRDHPTIINMLEALSSKPEFYLKEKSQRKYLSQFTKFVLNRSEMERVIGSQILLSISVSKLEMLADELDTQLRNWKGDFRSVDRLVNNAKDFSTRAQSINNKKSEMFSLFLKIFEITNDTKTRNRLWKAVDYLLKKTSLDLLYQLKYEKPGDLDANLQAFYVNQNQARIMLLMANSERIFVSRSLVYLVHIDPDELKMTLERAKKQETTEDNIYLANEVLEPFLNYKAKYTSYRLLATLRDSTTFEVRSLFDRNIDVNIKNSQGETFLILAVGRNDSALVHTLLERGAEVDTLAKYFIKHNDGSATKVHYTPLQFASRRGFISIVKILLENGADVNLAEGEDDYSPLHLASNYGTLEIVKKLLEKGAKVDAKDYNNMTPLHHAANNANLEIVEILIENGADVNAKDKRGRSILHEAVDHNYSHRTVNRMNKTETVRLLLENGANANAINNKGETVLDVARTYVNHTKGVTQEALKILRDAFANNVVSSFNKAQTIIDQTISVLGGVGTFKSIRSLLLKADVMGLRATNRYPEEYTITTLVAYPDRFRYHYSTRNGEVTRILHGDNGIMVTPRGEKQMDALAIQNAREELWYSLPYLFGNVDNENISLSYLGEVEVDNKNISRRYLVPEL